MFLRLSWGYIYKCKDTFIALKIFLLSHVNSWFSAILELYNPVDFFRESKPICLPQSAAGTESGLVTESYNYHDADIAGWGWTGKEWDPMGRLRAVTTKIWPKHFCEDVIEDAPAIFQRDVKHFQTCTFVYTSYDVQFIRYLYTFSKLQSTRFRVISCFSLRDGRYQTRNTWAATVRAIAVSRSSED